MANKREIPGRLGYMAGDDGSIWSCWSFGRKPKMTNQWRKLKPHAQKYGHLMISLRGRDCAFVHRLVLETFVGPCPPGMECRHLNGVAGDNRLENLAWGTPEENTQDRLRHGTQSRGVTNPGCKLTPENVLDIMQRRKAGARVIEIAKSFGVTSGAIDAILNGRSWNHVTGLPVPPQRPFYRENWNRTRRERSAAKANCPKT